MNFSEIANMLSTRISGASQPIIFIETCNIASQVDPSKPTDPAATRQGPPAWPSNGGGIGAAVLADDQGEETATESESPDPSPSVSPPQIAPKLRRRFGADGAMSTKQVLDSLINSGEYADLENHYGEETKRKIQTALRQMKEDGYLTRANGKQDTPYVPTEKLYDLLKISDQEANGAAGE